MKNLVITKIIFFCLSISVVLTSCQKENIDVIDTTGDEIDYTIEGKWLWSPSENIEDANTMYTFLDGKKYTSYCDNWPNLCDEDFWNALDSSDWLPGYDIYTFENNVLTIDDVIHGDAVTFDCEKVYFNNYYLWRLGADCE